MGVWGVLQAADVLIDEDTKQHCAQAIAHSLFQQDAPSRDDVEQVRCSCLPTYSKLVASG